MSSYHSCGMRVFRGCRALLAPAKSSAADVANAKSTTTTPARSKPKAKAKPRPAKAINQGTGTGLSSPKPKRETAGPRGILKVGPISPALQTFMGVPEASRSGAVKQIWSYIKGQNLQVPPTLLCLSLSISVCVCVCSHSFTFLYGFVFLISLRVLVLLFNGFLLD
jgi:upstream activation factor subunit UAF30